MLLWRTMSYFVGELLKEILALGYREQFCTFSYQNVGQVFGHISDGTRDKSSLYWFESTVKVKAKWNLSPTLKHICDSKRFYYCMNNALNSNANFGSWKYKFLRWEEKGVRAGGVSLLCCCTVVTLPKRKTFNVWNMALMNRNCVWGARQTWKLFSPCVVGRAKRWRNLKTRKRNVEV